MNRTSTTVTYSSEPVIFGVPLGENEDGNLHYAQAESLPAAQVVAEEMDILYGDSDFFDTVEILAHVEDDFDHVDSGCAVEVTAAAVALTAYPIDFCIAAHCDTPHAKLCMSEEDHFPYDADLYKEEFPYAPFVDEQEEKEEVKEDDDYAKPLWLLTGRLVSHCFPSSISSESTEKQSLCKVDVDTELKRKLRHEAILRWKQKRSTRATPHFRRVQRLKHQQRQRSTNVGAANSVRSRSDSISLALGKGVRQLTLSPSRCGQPKVESKYDHHNDQIFSEHHEIVNVRSAHANSFYNYNSLSNTGLIDNAVMNHISCQSSATLHSQNMSILTAPTAMSTSSLSAAASVCPSPSCPSLLSNVTIATSAVSINPECRDSESQACSSESFSGLPLSVVHQAPLPSARQQASAKRLREKGRFKKAQISWISVTDLFSSV